jgi:DNA-binding PadR family transcriptional regulator
MGRFEIEIRKEMDIVKNTRYVEEHLQDMVLSFLSEKPVSISEIVSTIFHKYGILVNSEKIYSLLESLRNKCLITEAKKGLLTVYSAVDKQKR